MPTRDSGEQQHKTRSAEDEQVDEALETNAEEFVRGFVQKGGQ